MTQQERQQLQQILKDLDRSLYYTEMEIARSIDIAGNVIPSADLQQNIANAWKQYRRLEMIIG